MIRPTFIIIGAQRAGTTSVHFSLARHPQVFMSRVKETNFFLRDAAGRLPPWVDDGIDERTPRTWQDYQALFTDSGPQRIAIGESSPSYLYAPCAVRIERMLPDAKLIAILRHPVEQARSILATWLGRPPTLNELVTQLASGAPGPRGELPLAQHGRYAEHLAPYYDLFPREHILVVKFGALERAPDELFRRVAEFLGVEPMRLPKLHLNASSQPRSRLVRELYSAKRLARALLPEKMLRGLTAAVHRLETANTVAKSGVPADLRTLLMDRYYCSDTKKLGSMTGLDVRPWLQREPPEPAARPAAERSRA